MSVAEDRERVLGELWSTIRSLNPQSIQNYPAAARAVASGASAEDVALAMTASAYEAVFGALYVLTGEEDIRDLAGSGAVSGLYEDLLGSDPTGREGSDLFE
jgi:hypothetical protein